MCLLMTKTDGVDLWLESLCRFFKIMLTQPLQYIIYFPILFSLGQQLVTQMQMEISNGPKC